MVFDTDEILVLFPESLIYCYHQNSVRTNVVYIKSYARTKHISTVLFLKLHIYVKCHYLVLTLLSLYICLFAMVSNATFNNISVISWGLVLLVDPEKTTDLSQVTDKLYHIKLYTSPWSTFELTTWVVIGTDCIVSCKSNYHTVTATSAPIVPSN